MEAIMARRTKKIVLILLLIVLLLVLGQVTWYYYPFSFLDSSIVVSERYVAIGGAIVENGSAFDRAVLDVTPYKTLILPDDAAVRDGAPAKEVQIFMQKKLSFGGHPPERMSIRGAR